MKNTETETKTAGVVISIICALFVAITQTGCAGSTGWRFEIGVSPVKELSNTAGLKQENENARKY